MILSSGPGRRIDKNWIFIEPKAAEEGNLRPPLRYPLLPYFRRLCLEPA